MATANEEIIARIQSGRMTHQQAEQLFAAAGINVAGGGGARTRALQADPVANQRLLSMIQGQGAMPIGIEPIHQFERAALTNVGQNPSGIGQDYLNPQSEQLLSRVGGMADKADSLLQQGSRDVNYNFDINKIDEFFNPFQEEVIGANNRSISDNAQRLRDSVLQNQRQMGKSSFGSLSQGQRLGDVDEQEIESIADSGANLRFGGWQTSLDGLFNRASGDMQAQEASRAGQRQAAQIYGGIGGTLSNAAQTGQVVQSTAFNDALRGNTAQAHAGSRIQGFNQGVADYTLADMQGQAQYPISRINTLLPLSQNFRSDTTQQYGQTDTRTSRFGNVLENIGAVGTGLSNAGAFDRFAR